VARITLGVRAILSRPVIYSSFQRIMGGHQARMRFVEDFVKPYPGMKVLDIGCGPADILAYLPEVDYWGFDISPAYIERARALFGCRGKFQCQELVVADIENMPPFDVVLALGLIHHLGDEEALAIMRLAYKALKPEGRLLTVDPCLEPGQSPIARFLVSNDRGKSVRNKAAYASFANAVFKSSRIEVRHQRWLPYTHCFMECTRK
jgi:SAM-dependent methyltransferase